MSNKNESTLTTKLSPLIEGQVPDFIQADHPIFVTFLKHYYEFLESGELQITVDIDNVLQETNSPAYILEESSAEKVVLETGSGTTGKFENNETITGSISKATAKVLVEDSSNGRLFISAQQKFVTGETITGQISGSTGIVTKYRGNPVQNIQQLMEYANPDNTIYDFLDSFRDQFMSAIPSTLADGVSKRNLIKSIKDLYTAKGTAAGHKYFLRLLLDDEATIKYPEEEMFRISDGRWTTKKIIRVAPIGSFDMSEVVGQTITGQTAGASAIVVNASSKLEGASTFTELELDPISIEGSFLENENIISISTITDRSILMTVKNIIADSTISNAGSLYTTTDSITTSSLIGNGGVNPKIDIVGRGSIDEIIIDDAGTGYEEGDVLTFTATGQSNTSTATAKVSVVSGMLILEDGGQILAEDENVTQIETIQLVSEDYFKTASGTSPNIVAEAGDPITLESFHNIVTSPENLLLPSTIGLTLEPGSSDKGIRKINLTNGGGGYSALPSITITSSAGADAKLLSSSNTIGSIEDVKLQTFGFDYSTAPEAVLNINVILKDISGTFTLGSPVYLNILPPLTVRGIISSWDTDSQLLTIAPSSTSPFKIDQEVGSNTAYSSVAGENIILEDGGIFSLEDSDQFVVTDTNKIILETGVDRIVDEENGYPIIAEASLQEGIVYQSGSIYGTIASVKVGKVDLSVGTLTTTDGLYLTSKNLLGESEIRIQDSYYYQQFSYEIQVGASAAEYLDSLKKAVHPSGFLPFGKVSIATKVVAAMKILTAGDIPSYTADTESFTPELASMFELVFDTLFGRRLGTVDDGTTLNTVPAEGVNDDFLTDTNLGTTSGKRDLTLTHEVLVTMQQQPYNTSNPNALKYLNLFPFMHSGVNIELETQTGSTGTLVAFDITERLTTNFNALHGTLNENLDTTETVIVIDDSLGRTPDFNTSSIRKFVVGQVIQFDDESMKITGLDANYLNGLSNIILEDDLGNDDLLLEDFIGGLIISEEDVTGLEATVIRGYDTTNETRIIIEDGGTDGSGTDAGDSVLYQNERRIGVEDELQVVTVGDKIAAEHGNNAIVKLNNYTWDRTDGDPTTTSSNYPTFDNGESVGGFLLLTAADVAGSNDIILETGDDRFVSEEDSDPFIVEDFLQELVQMSIGERLIIEDGSDENALTSPTFSSLGDVSTGIKFTDIFQYHVLRLEGDVYNESLLLEDGDDLLLEDADQATTRLQWPDSIWSHPKEKAFTIPAEINISAA